MNFSNGPLFCWLSPRELLNLRATFSMAYRHGRSMHQNSQRIPALDGLRGVLAMIVMLTHGLTVFGTPWWLTALEQTPLQAFWAGRAAVSFFFVLSGYVLARSLRVADASPGGFGLGEYIVARVARIWLPYAGVILVMAWGSQHGWIPAPSAALTAADVNPWFWNHWRDPLSWQRFINELDLFTASGRYLLNPPAWSLRVEMVLSLLLPLLVLLLKRPLSWVLLAGVLLFGVDGIHIAVYQLHFTFGALLATHEGALVRLWRSGRAAARAMYWLVAILIYTAGFVVVPRTSLQIADEYYAAIEGLGAVLILAGILATRSAARVLNYFYFCRDFSRLSRAPQYGVRSMACAQNGRGARGGI